MLKRRAGRPEESLCIQSQFNASAKVVKQRPPSRSLHIPELKASMSDKKRRTDDIDGDGQEQKRPRRSDASSGAQSTLQGWFSRRKPAAQPTPQTEPAPTQSPASPDSEPKETTTLPELLDFSSLETDASIRARFHDIANSLLTSQLLVVTAQDGTKTEFELLEIEFYLRKDKFHEDPYTHASEEQRVAGKWYFHRAPRKSNDSTKSVTSPTEYRSGSRKGLDLTMGGPVGVTPRKAPAGSSDADTPLPTPVRGGILFRAIRPLRGQGSIAGPSLLVDHILKLSGANSIEQLVDDYWLRDTSAFPPLASSSTPERTPSLYLTPYTRSDKERPLDIYRSPRIGLDLSQCRAPTAPTHPRVVFVARPYRYWTRGELLAGKGRKEGFVGTYQFLMKESEGTLNDQKAALEVSRRMGMKVTDVGRYMKDYKHGVEKGKLEDFIGQPCRDTATYTKMMGTLSKLLPQN